MDSFDAELRQRLDQIQAQGLRRQLQPVEGPQGPRIHLGSRVLLNFSSNDYLGLANEPALKEAALKAVERYGVGSGASRLICGSLAPHQELEDALAEFKDSEAALGFSSGYAAALGTITALMGKDDVIVVDKLAHACIIDAARLCGAKLRVFDHNNLADLESILRWADTRLAAGLRPAPPIEGPHLRPARRHVLIVTESVFSMDGDHAPLRELVDLKDRFGAWLMVDEAHATGLYGRRRRGLAEALDVSSRIEIHMGTLGKALGVAGGYICGSRWLVDYLVNRARSFIFSTAPPPGAAAAATAGVRLVQSELGEQRCQTLWKRIASLRPTVETRSAQPPPERRGAITPLMIGDETQAVAASAALRERGLFIPAIRYPTVARGQARLRLTLTAAHSEADVGELRSALADLALSA